MPKKEGEVQKLACKVMPRNKNKFSYMSLTSHKISQASEHLNKQDSNIDDVHIDEGARTYNADQ